MVAGRKVRSSGAVGWLGGVSTTCDARSGSLERMVRRCGHLGFCFGSVVWVTVLSLWT